MPIQSVTLTNFRGFKRHTVAFNEVSVLVGHNNAGKSTLIDALRLLTVASEKALSANYSHPPLWLRSYTTGRGFSTTFKTVDFDFENLGYNQDQEEPAKLELRFKNKSVLTLWLDTVEQANFVQLQNSQSDYAVKRVASAAKLKFHCWKMKEIENYFATPRLIAKYVSAHGNKAISISAAQDLVQECANDLIAHCCNNIRDNYYRPEEDSKASAHFESVAAGRPLHEVVGGKRLISKVSAKLQKSWGCQLSAINLCRVAELDDLDDEIINLVRTLSSR